MYQAELYFSYSNNILENEIVLFTITLKTLKYLGTHFTDVLIFSTENYKMFLREVKEAVNEIFIMIVE